MVSTERLHQHVIAVPPLARKSDGSFCDANNQKIIDHIVAGGVKTFLYGGNAMVYHMPMSVYEDMLGFLASLPEDLLLVPSLGPSFGLMMDQAKCLAAHAFPTAMILPTREIADDVGIERAVHEVAEALNRPVVLYLKFENYLSTETVSRLFESGAISWIKYAVVRQDPKDDEELTRLVDAVDQQRIISGIGEQPAIIHMRDFGLGGYTSGCVCVNPTPSQRMLGLCRDGNWDAAEEIRESYEPLEDLRNEIHPISVLHEAVQLAGIAQTGAVPPLLSPLSDVNRERVNDAVNS
ncbi:MAG: dihydrodipicolinate synthase family protein [Planctomycetota bacterium]